MSHICCTCGDAINMQHLEGKQTSSNPLGKQCIQCRNESVTRNSDVQHLFSESLVSFFNNVLGLPLDEWDIKVLMCDPSELRLTTPSGVDHVHTGECISSVSVHHVAPLNNSNNNNDTSSSDLIHKRTVKEIRLLKGMHVELVARTIAHEAMHGWIALWRGQPCGTKQCHACPPRLSDLVAEGLCEYAAYTFLEHRQRKLSSKSHSYKVIQYTKSRMLTNTSGVYAEGLSLALTSMKNGSGDKLKRSKNASFFKQVFALSRFPTKQVLTPMKYNGEMSASLGTCKFCCREIEPSSTTVFEFVVVGDDFNGTNGSKSGGIKTCVCLSCYEASRPCCKWCKEPLHKAPTVKGQDVHRDCFMKYENKHGDRCHVCKELLWEEDKIGGFQRRTSYTSGSGDQNNTSKQKRKKEVHERCGDRCAQCQIIFQNEKFLTFEKVKLHDACFDTYQKASGMLCGRCHLPLWRQSSDGDRNQKNYVRKTRMDDNGIEIHVECGDKCIQCKTLLKGKFITLGKDQIHEDCFHQYQLSTAGMCCNVCNLPLWRKGDGAATNAAGGYGRKTCMTTDQKTGKEIEIHVACSDRCLYCNIVLFERSPHQSKQIQRRGSVVTVDKTENKRVHDACYLLYQHSKPSECCGECGDGLWTLESGSFSRRSSVTDANVHLCKSCVKKYTKGVEDR